MTQAEVKLMLDELGIPSAYYQFAENTGVEPPFICYFFGNSKDFSADNINYVHLVPLYIELYTDTKDFELEGRLEGMLNDRELFYTREETFLDSERMHETIYQTDIVLEANNG